MPYKALVLAAGAATLTAVAMAAQNPSFKTSPETKEDGDFLSNSPSLVAEKDEEESPDGADGQENILNREEHNEHTEEGTQQEEEQMIEVGKALSLGDIEKKVMTVVTIEEVPLTPGLEVDFGWEKMFAVETAAIAA